MVKAKKGRGDDDDEPPQPVAKPAGGKGKKGRGDDDDEPPQPVAKPAGGKGKKGRGDSDDDAPAAKANSNNSGNNAKGKGGGKKGRDEEEDVDAPSRAKANGKGGKKGRGVSDDEDDAPKAAPKAKGKKGQDSEGEGDEDAAPAKGKKGGKKGRAASDEEDDAPAQKAAAGKSKGKKGRAAKDSDDDAEEEVPAPAAKGKAKKSKGRAGKDSDDDSVAPAPSKGKKGGKKDRGASEDEVDDDGGGEEAPAPSPVPTAHANKSKEKAKKGKGKKGRDDSDESDGDGESAGQPAAPSPAPATKGKGKKGKGKKARGASDESEEDAPAASKPAKGGKGGAKASAKKEESEEEEEDDADDEPLYGRAAQSKGASAFSQLAVDEGGDEGSDEEHGDSEGEKDAAARKKAEGAPEGATETEGAAPSAAAAESAPGTDGASTPAVDEDDIERAEGDGKRARGAAAALGGKRELTRKARKALERLEEQARRDAELRKQAESGTQFSVSQAGAASAKEQASFNNATDIKVDKFSISAGGKDLFVNASLTIATGRRYGLVGPNGMGKTTLLKQIATRALQIPSNIDILYVEQEIEADDTPVVDVVLAADEHRLRLLEEEKRLLEEAEKSDASFAATDRLKEVYDELNNTGAASAEARARKILYGLGFEPDQQKRPTKSFSGGWRMRVSLARALFIQPTLLLLDEPTNHLDLNAVIWLDSYLQKWKKMLLVVSHDQDFLNNVCTDIIHLENQQLNYYRGNYYDFKKMHAQKMVEVAKQYEKQERKLRELKKSGHSSKQAEEKATRVADQKLRHGQKNKGMVDEANEPQKAELIKRPKEYIVHFEFPEPTELSPPILEIIDAGFRYGDGPVLFEDLNFGITMESRVTIVGPNGVGKSTLLNIMTGVLEPTTGEARRNRKLRIGRFNQHFVDQLPMHKTPVEYLVDKYNEKLNYQQARGLLGKYGLGGHAHTIKIKELSGGQKARVAFVDVALGEPHILFFDEPTNHLDLESIDALIDAINDFKGGVVIVSHDARLIKSTNCELWVCANKTCEAWEGDFDDYRDAIIKDVESIA